MDREASAVSLVVVTVSVAMTERPWPRIGGGGFPCSTTGHAGLALIAAAESVVHVSKARVVVRLAPLLRTGALAAVVTASARGHLAVPALGHARAAKAALLLTPARTARVRPDRGLSVRGVAGEGSRGRVRATLRRHRAGRTAVLREVWPWRLRICRALHLLLRRVRLELAWRRTIFAPLSEIGRLVRHLVNRG